jgi:hypothetical protein
MIMVALSPKARALIQEGRKALRPTQTDRERVAAGLRTELGPGALPPQASVPPPPPVGAATGWGALASKVLVGVGLVGGALYLALGREPTPVPQAHVSEAPSAPAAMAAPPSTLDAPRKEAPPTLDSPEVAPPPAHPTAVPSESSGSRARDRLAEEVALLSRATTALRAGRVNEALKALDEHQSKFPRGVLSEERRAGKAQALCSLGRMSEGRAELGHLAPQSPAAARAKQACDSGPK